MAKNRLSRHRYKATGINMSLAFGLKAREGHRQKAKKGNRALFRECRPRV